MRKEHLMDNDIEAVDPVEQCFEHFGILGMKWGRRRSTRELQAARGKKDWEGDSDKNSGKDSTEGPQAIRKESDNEKYQRLSRMKVQDMSTQEINDWVNRTNAIANYNRLTAQQKEASRSKGQKFIHFMLDTGKSMAIDAGKEIAKDYLKTALKGYAESKIAPSTPRHAKSKKKKK
jgi:hypothetical protein